jgi:HK97 family phage portal protein
MIQRLKNIFNGGQSFLNSPVRDENLLNRIIYGLSNNNAIIWYDGKQDTFINEGYRGNAMVYSIIRKIADKSKGCELQVFKESKNAKSYKEKKRSTDDLVRAQAKIYKKELDLVVDSDPVLKLMKNPNPYQTWKEFLDNISIWYNTTGEVFIYGFAPDMGVNAGKFQELWVMPSNYVEIIQGDMFKPVQGYKLAIGDQTIHIPQEEVLHIKMPNLVWDVQGTQLRGQSPLLAGSKFMQKNTESLTAGYKAMQNEGAKGIISPNLQNPDLWPNPEQRAKIDQRVDERINGSENRNRVITSSIPLKYDSIGLSPVSLDIINSMKYDDEKLCGLWGISPALFVPNATDQNFKHAQKGLVTDVVVPQLQHFEEKLTEWIQTRFGNEYIIDFDTTTYAELQPDLKLLFETYGKSYAFTGNELRVMAGWEENKDKPELEAHWIGSNMVPASDQLLGGINPDFQDFQP